jgi:hypothetical protein
MKFTMKETTCHPYWMLQQALCRFKMTLNMTMGMLTIGMMVQKLTTKQSCRSPPLMAVRTNTSTISHPISPVVTPHLLGL